MTPRSSSRGFTSRSLARSVIRFRNVKWSFLFSVWEAVVSRTMRPRSLWLTSTVRVARASGAPSTSPSCGCSIPSAITSWNLLSLIRVPCENKHCFLQTKVIYRRSCHRSASPFSFARRRSSRSSPAASRTKCIHSRLLHTSPPNRHSERNSESRSTNEHSSILPPGVPSTSPQRLPDAPPTAGSHFPPGRLRSRESCDSLCPPHSPQHIPHFSLHCSGACSNPLC